MDFGKPVIQRVNMQTRFMSKHTKELELLKGESAARQCNAESLGCRGMGFGCEGGCAEPQSPLVGPIFTYHLY